MTETTNIFMVAENKHFLPETCENRFHTSEYFSPVTSDLDDRDTVLRSSPHSMWITSLSCCSVTGFLCFGALLFSNLVSFLNKS